MKEKENIEPIYTITGTVVHGRGIGKHVGTPTANIEVDEHATLPETGVYVAKILLDSQTYYGVTHVGMRPTLDNDKAIAIETHIFDFDNDIYGCTITIQIYKKLREVRKFDELSLLIEQVATDRLSARMLMVNKEAQQNRTRTASPTAIPYSKRSHKNLEQ